MLPIRVCARVSRVALVAAVLAAPPASAPLAAQQEVVDTDTRKHLYVDEMAFDPSGEL